MAKPTRFPFGIALGWENQFNNYGKGGNGLAFNAATQQYEQTTAGLLSQASTAPDVSFGSLFYTNNTSNTIITDFKQTWSGRAGALTSSGQTDTSGPPPEGKLITVVFLDNSTQLANAGNLVLNGTNNLIGVNNMITLLGSNGKWYEMARSYNNTAEVTTFLLTGASSINVAGVKVALLNNTGSLVDAISALSGGQVGQIINFALVGSNSVKLVSGGNISFAAGTNAAVINASGTYQFVNVGGNAWRQTEIV